MKSLLKQFAVPLTFCASTMGGLTIVAHPIVGTLLVVTGALCAMVANHKRAYRKPFDSIIEWPNGDRDTTPRFERLRSIGQARIVLPVLEDETVFDLRRPPPITGETPTLPI